MTYTCTGVGVGLPHAPRHDGGRSGRRAGTDRADEQQRALVRLPPQRAAALFSRVVEQPDRGVVATEVTWTDDRRERVDPWTMRCRRADHRRSVADRVDEPFECGRLTRHRCRNRGAGCDGGDPLDRQSGRNGAHGTRGVGDLEHDQLVGAESQHGSAGRTGWESSRQGIADHIVCVGAILEPERDPQVGVGPDVIGDDARRTLRGQHEVDAEAATALGDRHERAQEVGEFLGQRRELVDHHHQARQRFRDGAAVGGQVVGSGGSQESFAATHLGVEAHQHPLGETVVEVGHDTDRVREPGAGVERRAALVVDQDHRDVVRTRPCGERHDQRAQQFALSRTRGAGDQAVRAVAYEIDVDDAVGRHSEAGDRCRVAAAVLPPSRDRRRGVVVDRFEFGQRDAWRNRACAVVVLGIEQRGQPSCRGLGRRRRDAGDDDVTVERGPGRAARLDPPRCAGVTHFEDPIDDRRDRDVGSDDGDAGDAAAIEPAAQRRWCGR